MTLQQSLHMIERWQKPLLTESSLWSSGVCFFASLSMAHPYQMQIYLYSFYYAWAAEAQKDEY